MVLCMKHSEWQNRVVIKPSVLLQPSPGCKNSKNEDEWNNMKQKLSCWYFFEWDMSMLTTYRVFRNLWTCWLDWNSAIFRYYMSGYSLRTWNGFILKRKKMFLCWPGKSEKCAGVWQTLKSTMTLDWIQTVWAGMRVKPKTVAVTGTVGSGHDNSVMSKLGLSSSYTPRALRCNCSF